VSYALSDGLFMGSLPSPFCDHYHLHSTVVVGLSSFVRKTVLASFAAPEKTQLSRLQGYYLLNHTWYNHHPFSFLTNYIL